MTLKVLINLIFFCFLNAAFAVQIRVGTSNSNYGPYQHGNGGEFTLTQLDSYLSLDGYVMGLTSYVDEGSNSFQSFCIEFSENINGNSVYEGVVNPDGAVNGGLNGLNPDPISVGTGWLYSEFATGQLDGYDYYNSSSRRSYAFDLQNAIWMLEGEITPVFSNGSSGNFYLDLVLNEIGNGVNYDSFVLVSQNGGTTEYGVYALNLFNNDFAQDQLYYNPLSKKVSDSSSFSFIISMLLIYIFKRNLSENG